MMETDINLPFITADASGPEHLTMGMTRARTEKLVEDLIAKLEALCRTAMKMPIFRRVNGRGYGRPHERVPSSTEEAQGNF